MTVAEFRESLAHDEPPKELSAPLAALWWDAKDAWAQAHSMVDELESKDGMAVHAYLHRKEGDEGNAGYWYARAGKPKPSASLAAEWEQIARVLLADAE